MAALEEIEFRQTGKRAVSAIRTHTGMEIESEEQFAEIFGPALAAASLSQLLTRARAESGLTLEQVGIRVGSGKSWVHQAENKENLEVISLVKLASAMGYPVEIRLEPELPGRKPLTVRLDSKS